MMRHVLIALALVGSTLRGTLLGAQSATAQTPMSIAGCYALTLGPWENPYPSGEVGWQVLPSIFRLDTAETSWKGAGPRWRRVTPTPAYFTASSRGMEPAWSVVSPDSVSLFWSTGFVGTRFQLAVRSDTLVGRAVAFTDVRGGPPDPVAAARAVRVRCPQALLPAEDTLPARVVQRFVDAANARDAHAMAELVAVDARFERFPGGQLLVQSRDSIRAHYTRSLGAASPEFSIAVRPRIVEGQFVIDQEHFTGVQGPRTQATWMYLVRNGLIQRAWVLDSNSRP